MSDNIKIVNKVRSNSKKQSGRKDMKETGKSQFVSIREFVANNSFCKKQEKEEKEGREEKEEEEPLLVLAQNNNNYGYENRDRDRERGMEKSRNYGLDLSSAYNMHTEE